MRRIVLLVLCLLVPATAVAQKRCKKGIPCGGTCIAANKTCRVGTSAPSTAATADTTRAAAASGAWVASSKGKTYYRAGCAGANRLAVANRIFFKSEEDAKAAGYSHSTQKGC